MQYWWKHNDQIEKQIKSYRIPFYFKWLTEIMAWINNYIHDFMWDESLTHVQDTVNTVKSHHDKITFV